MALKHYQGIFQLSYNYQIALRQFQELLRQLYSGMVTSTTLKYLQCSVPARKTGRAHIWKHKFNNCTSSFLSQFAVLFFGFSYVTKKQKQSTGYVFECSLPLPKWTQWSKVTPPSSCSLQTSLKMIQYLKLIFLWLSCKDSGKAPHHRINNLFSINTYSDTTSNNGWLGRNRIGVKWVFSSPHRRRILNI